MTKAILKKLIPPILLKRVFLIFNTIKLNTIDPLFFPALKIPTDHFQVRTEKNPFLEMDISMNNFDDEVREKFKIWTNPKWDQDEYLYVTKQPGWIEPHTGWGMNMNRELIFPSLGFSSAPHVHKPDFFETYFKKKKVGHLNRIISLRDTGEENYFHFFNDVLSKLFYLTDHGLKPRDYTIVISDRMYRKQYVQFFLKTPFLSSLQWHIQKDEWIHFNEAIFCKPYTHTKKYLDRAIDLVTMKMEKSGDRRIFLTRAPHSLRFIENFEEIEPMLKKFQFEVVDASRMSMMEQIYLFSQCRYLIAIHGAGITNIIFRQGQPLSLLEIVQPFPYIPFHYIMLAKLFDYSYDVLLGRKGKLTGMGGFRVEPTELNLKMQKLLC
jgi:hypothetical protein